MRHIYVLLAILILHFRVMAATPPRTSGSEAEVLRSSLQGVAASSSWHDVPLDPGAVAEGFSIAPEPDVVIHPRPAGVDVHVLGEGGAITRVWSRSVEPTNDLRLTARVQRHDGEGAIGLLWGGRNRVFRALLISDREIVLGTMSRKGIKPTRVTKNDRAFRDGTIDILVHHEAVSVYLNGAAVFTVARAQVSELGGEIGFVVEAGVRCGISDVRLQVADRTRLMLPADLSVSRSSVGPLINTRQPELIGAVTADGNSMYFSRKNDAGDYDIWRATRNASNEWAHQERLLGTINSSGNDHLLSITKDGELALVTDGGPTMKLIRCDRGTWGPSERVVIPGYYNRDPAESACMSPDGRSILISALRDDSYGGHDLYISRRKPDGTWSELQNLGPTVNTHGDEFGPFIASDGVTLYFSSTGRVGYGDADLFVTRSEIDLQTWTEPANLGPEINTAGFDAYIAVPADPRTAYITRGDKARMDADIECVTLPVAIRPIIDTKLNVVAVGPDGTELTDAIIEVQRSDDGEFVEAMVSHAGYLTKSIRSQLDHGVTEQTITVVLEPMRASARFIMRNLYFEHGSSVLQPGEQEELTVLLQTLLRNPSATIILHGHTDDVGSHADNDRLSLDRARAVKEWLIDHSIEPSRVDCQGHGERDPLNANASAEDRAANRRVEVHFQVNEIALTR